MDAARPSLAAFAQAGRIALELRRQVAEAREARNRERDETPVAA